MLGFFILECFNRMLFFVDNCGRKSINYMTQLKDMDDILGLLWNDLFHFFDVLDIPENRPDVKKVVVIQLHLLEMLHTNFLERKLRWTTHMDSWFSCVCLKFIWWFLDFISWDVHCWHSCIGTTFKEEYRPVFWLCGLRMRYFCTS